MSPFDNDNEVMFASVSVGLFVCQQQYSKTTEQFFMEFCGPVGHIPGTNQFSF